MIWSSFDENQDGELTDLEWLRLKVSVAAQLLSVVQASQQTYCRGRHSRPRGLRQDKLSVAHTAIMASSASKDLSRSPEGLLQLYESRGGAGDLQRDLRTLGISFGAIATQHQDENKHYDLWRKSCRI